MIIRTALRLPFPLLAKLVHVAAVGDQFRSDKRHLVMDTPPKNADDGWVLQLGARFRFASEALGIDQGAVESRIENL